MKLSVQNNFVKIIKVSMLPTANMLTLFIPFYQHSKQLVNSLLSKSSFIYDKALAELKGDLAFSVDSEATRQLV
ncbi:hypothetical protein [Amphibacillus xylanus]|nr:hypothetical protein [Amphibacillus xylanus]